MSFVPTMSSGRTSRPGATGRRCRHDVRRGRSEAGAAPLLDSPAPWVSPACAEDLESEWHDSPMGSVRARCRNCRLLCSAFQPTSTSHTIRRRWSRPRRLPRYNASIAFDAEDFETGYCYATGPTAMDRLIESFERQYLPLCCYAAASPGIAEAYSAKYAIPVPSSILNVFPLADRPQKFRPTKPDGPLQLYWFSQTIGLGRGLEDIIQAMGRVTALNSASLRGIWAPRPSQGTAQYGSVAGRWLARIVDMSLRRRRRSDRSGRVRRGSRLGDPVSKSRELCLTNKIFSYLLLETP